MINSTYDPTNINAFEKTKLNLNITGIRTTFVAGAVTNMDLKLLDDNLMTGVTIGINGANLGDTFSLQVVDIDNVLGHGANLVLNTFASSYNVVTDNQKQIDYVNSYPARLRAGLYIRVALTSTGTSNGKMFANYILHKVLL